MSKDSDTKNTLDLFGGFISQNESPDLKTEQAFVEYAKKIGAILAKEERKKYIQEFMKELLQQLYPKLGSGEYEVNKFLVNICANHIQEIHSKCTTLFNQKQKDEKGPSKDKKKRKINILVRQYNSISSCC